MRLLPHSIFLVLLPLATAARAEEGPQPPTEQSLQGTLVASDATRPGGQFTQTYTFVGRTGQHVRIDLRSSELDAYLLLTGPAGLDITNDDAGAGDTDARIETTLGADGTYRLSASSFVAGETGKFTLDIDGIEAPLVADTSAAGAKLGEIWAIIIGVTDYDGGGDLPNCRRDAERLAGALVYDGRLDASRLTLLTDSEATLEGVRRAFADIAARMQPDDTFLFFFSGHGTRGEYDASATDEADRRDESLSLRGGALTDNELKTLFASVPANLAILCLDACFSGGFARDVISQPGRLGLFSSEEDVNSIVAPELNAGGYLAHYFRIGLRGAADQNADGTLTVGELVRYLRSEFYRLELETTADDGSVGYQRLVVERGSVKLGARITAAR